MGTIRIVLAGAGAAVLLAATAVGTSDTAEAVMVCRDRVAGEGTGRGVADQRELLARAAALANWSRNVEARFGIRFSSPSMARTIRYDCRRGVLEAKCAVTAVPCADIPRATGGKAKQKKKKKKKSKRS